MDAFLRSEHYSKHATLQSALQQQKRVADGCRVFGFDLETSTNGSKFFVLAGMSPFWSRFSPSCYARNRTSNEILMEDCPTKMYFDIDVPKTPAVVFHCEPVVAAVLAKIRMILVDEVGAWIEGGELVWNLYNSSSSKKYSYHLVLQNVVMASVAHCGALYRHIELLLRKDIENGLLSKSNFFHKNNDGIEECVLDHRVYTRKRLFRTLYASKSKRNMFLLPDTELDQQSNLQYELGEQQRQNFLESLLQIFVTALPADQPYSIREVSGGEPRYTTHTGYRMFTEATERKSVLSLGMNPNTLAVGSGGAGLILAANHGPYDRYRLGRMEGDNVTGGKDDVIDVRGRGIPKLCVLLGNELGQLLDRSVLYYSVTNDGYGFRYQWKSRVCFVHGTTHKSNHTITTISFNAGITMKHGCYHDDRVTDKKELPLELVTAPVIHNALDNYLSSLIPAKEVLLFKVVLAPVLDCIPLI